jgi:GT2 family glycosyltransferase
VNGERPAVSIVVVPRDHFSDALRSLETLLRNTPPPYELIYVDGGSPAYVARRLQAKADAGVLRLVRRDEYLGAAQARNLGVAEAHGRYLVFIDNDALVTPGWLDALVGRAESSGAWAVCPTYLIGEPELGLVHSIGTQLRLTGPPGARRYEKTREHTTARLADVAPALAATPTTYIELHCVLITAAAVDALGGFDEGFGAMFDHDDIALRIAELGGTIWFEPTAVVSYVSIARRPPEVGRIGSPWRPSDLPFFVRAWAEAPNARSRAHFARKHGIDEASLPDVGGIAVFRQALFTPLRAALSRRFGPRVDNGVAHVLYRAERVVNRVLVR